VAHLKCTKHQKRSNVINSKISHRDNTPCDANEGKIFKSLVIGDRFVSIDEMKVWINAS
jgi:hypothetical protein